MSSRPPDLPAEVILTHVGADFDGLAAMVCAQKLYPGARIMLSGSPDPLVREFLNLHCDHFDVESARGVDRLSLARVVLVDVQVPSRLGEFRDRVMDPRVEVHVYDHHPATQESIRGDLHVVETVGATTTLLVERLMGKRIGDQPAAPRITPVEATLFLLGIYEETGSMTFPDTTPRDLKAAAWLLERGGSLQVVADYTHHPLRAEQRELLNRLLAACETLDLKGLQVVVTSVELDAYVGELALLVHRLMDLERPDAMFCLARMKNRVYVVGRSREGGPDVGRLLERMGGGGHARAASASLRHTDLQAARDELMRLLREALAGHPSARDVMSSPVQAVEVTDQHVPTVAEAQAAFVRYGHQALPVVKDGRLLGMLGRREVDKAINHELGASEVTRFMTPPQATAMADTALVALERIFASPQVSRVPVLDESGEEPPSHPRLVGIVTRSDLLAGLHGTAIQEPLQSETVERIRALPEFMQHLLARAGEVGDALEVPVYAVGGFVRDLLLRVENLDLDLVVEGDGIAYAERLAAELGGRSRPHEKFQTAVVVAPADLKIDVVSSRLEFYTRPAALPDVTGSTIKQDLFRRDFTINAIAVQLNHERGSGLSPARAGERGLPRSVAMQDSCFGRLVDFFGGRRDLRDRVIRVLHSLSFIDDPTRIFRAIKFEQRLHFKMEPHTEQLLRQAIDQDVLELVSPKRIMDEFVQILDETRPVPAIERMEELRVLRLIHPRLLLTTRVRELLAAVTATLTRFEPLVRAEGLERWVIYFRALVSVLTQEQIAEVGHRFPLGVDSQRRMLLDKASVKHLIRRLYRRMLLPSEIHRLLSPLSTEMVLYLLARSKARTVREKIMLYLDRLRGTKPMVTGRDLMDWGMQPGPAMGRALHRLLAAQLDGKIRTPEEARAFLEEEDMVAAWT